jgi:hypothetical protein
MIKVIDAMCGAGKSTAMIKKMKDNPATKWLYITPFLTEVEERIPIELPELHFKTPSDKDGTKTGDIDRLISQGHNIATTHSLFRLFTGQIIDKLIQQKYVLVIDESVDAISQYKGDLNASDIHALVTGDFVSYDQDNRNRLIWNEDKYPDHQGKYKEVRDMCLNNMLYCYKDKFLMCEFPPKLLSNLDEVYVLTYMFRACTMRYWLEINDIKYDYVGHNSIGLRSEAELKQLARDNIQIISNRTLDTLQASQTFRAFGVRWFDKLETERRDKYKAIMRSCVVMHKVTEDQIFWTTYKRQEKFLANTGYTRRFLPLNIKATNDHKDKTFCMYAANLHSNPMDAQYIDSLGVEVSDEDLDLFCLSNLIQFIYRGCVRQEKPMKVLILSKRVLKLLEKWLNEGAK